MYPDLLDFLQYSFVQRAFLAGSFVAVLCAVLGLFLVLRKMSLIGDGLAHVSFGSFALGLFLGVHPLYVAIPVAVLGAWLVLKISERAKVYGDAAIGIVSAVGIAGGVMLASLSGGFNVDLFSYLFGSILSISAAEVWLSVAMSAAVLVAVLLFYHDLFSITFDEEHARVSGIRADWLNLLLAVLTAVSVVLSVRVVGVMLVSSLLILPAVTALQVARGFRGALMLGAFTAVLSVIVGITASFFLNLPTGASVVMVNLLFFLAALAVRTRHRG